MESPVIVDNCAKFSVPNETGFPFDDTEYDSNDHFQTRLNDIAQRHPEFANHLQFESFPTLRRKRYGSGCSTDREDVRPQTPGQSSASFDTPDNREFTGDSFLSGFNRFPFTSHFGDFADGLRSDEKPPEVPRTQDKRGRKVNPNLPQHLSNTVDLGQKQAPVEENRSQRSMSAPPENRTTHSNTPRFDSDSSREDPKMGLFGSKTRKPHPSQPQFEPQAQQQYQPQYQPQAQPQYQPQYQSQAQPQYQHQQSPQPSSAGKPKERVIPIFVEGRDEPLIPKNVNSSESERVFGGEQAYHNRGGNASSQQHQEQQYQKPQQNYMHQQSRPQQYASPHEQASRQQAAPSYQEQGAKQATPPHPTHHTKQQTPPAQSRQGSKQTPPPQEQAPPQNTQQEMPTAKSLNDPLEKIKSVKNDVLDLMQQVQSYAGTRKDKLYIYLDEMLTRNLLKLDNIETEGKENIRLARREAIKCIQECINMLEAQAQANEKKNTELVKVASAEAIPPTPENPSEEMIQSEQQHAKETQKPVFRSEAKLIVRAVGDVPMEAAKVEETSVVEQTPPISEPMELDTTAVLVPSVSTAAPSSPVPSVVESVVETPLPEETVMEQGAGDTADAKSEADLSQSVVKDPSQSADETNL